MMFALFLFGGLLIMAIGMWIGVMIERDRWMIRDRIGTELERQGWRDRPSGIKELNDRRRP